MPALNTLHDLMVQQLKDVYSAERQLVQALPRMAKHATNEELKDGFIRHLEQTEEQVGRLDRVFESLGVSPRGTKCAGMEGLLEEGKEFFDVEDLEVRDAGLIAAAQRVEHYEIAAYGTIVEFARAMGHDEIVQLLEQTLDEEKDTDAQLTALAEGGINQLAQRGEGEEDEEGEEIVAPSRSTSGSRAGGAARGGARGGSSPCRVWTCAAGPSSSSGHSDRVTGRRRGLRSAIHSRSQERVVSSAICIALCMRIAPTPAPMEDEALRRDALGDDDRERRTASAPAAMPFVRAEAIPSTAPTTAAPTTIGTGSSRNRLRQSTVERAASSSARMEARRRRLSSARVSVSAVDLLSNIPGCSRWGGVGVWAIDGVGEKNPADEQDHSAHEQGGEPGLHQGGEPLDDRDQDQHGGHGHHHAAGDADHRAAARGRHTFLHAGDRDPHFTTHDALRVGHRPLQQGGDRLGTLTGDGAPPVDLVSRVDHERWRDVAARPSRNPATAASSSVVPGCRFAMRCTSRMMSAPSCSRT